jgi:hypothetical protein
MSAVTGTFIMKKKSFKFRFPKELSESLLKTKVQFSVNFNVQRLACRKCIKSLQRENSPRLGRATVTL